MAWYDEAVFYHIYPLGLTGAPRENSYETPVHRLNTLVPWISHIKEIGCNALYIGPLFESVGHGYETTDYKKLDSRLGTNEDLTDFVARCHEQGIRVILDGVFNHTGRDFFAFQDIKTKRENSQYRDWYCNVNFAGNNEYNDGFSYDNWGGYNLLAKLNQNNPAVRDYICDVVRFWVTEFDIDGIRLDAADVLDFNFMHALRQVANEVKPDFWLMGEVIHGDYSRWVNEGTLHSVTNYVLHKALYSGHNDHNYFEIAHTVKYLDEMGGSRPDGLKLYNFVDNHDVERIYTKLDNKKHFMPVHILMYTLPGVPSVYYGSEFGIEGKKEQGSDASLRPALAYEKYADAIETNECTKLIAALGRIRQNSKVLSYGDYNQLLLTNLQYAFARTYNGQSVIVTVNNGDEDYPMNLPAGNAGVYVGSLSGERVIVNGGYISVNVKANSGEIWMPAEMEEGEKIPEQPQTVEEGENTPEQPQTIEEGENTPEQPQTVEEGENTPEQPQTVEEGENTPEQPQTVEEGENILEQPQTIEEGEKIPEQPQTVEEGENTPEQPQTTEEVANASGQLTSAEEQKEHTAVQNKSYEEMTIEELQEAILERMRRNGPVTDQMKKDVMENVYHNSLVTWIRSFGPIQ